MLNDKCAICGCTITGTDALIDGLCVMHRKWRDKGMFCLVGTVKDDSKKTITLTGAYTHLTIDTMEEMFGPERIEELKQMPDYSKGFLYVDDRLIQGMNNDLETNIVC